MGCVWSPRSPHGDGELLELVHFPSTPSLRTLWRRKIRSSVESSRRMEGAQDIGYLTSLGEITPQQAPKMEKVTLGFREETSMVRSIMAADVSLDIT